MSLWRWLGLPVLISRRLGWLAVAIAAVIMLYGLARATGWQNAVYAAVGMGPAESARPLIIVGVSVVVAALLILIGRVFRRVGVIAANRLAILLPPRVALPGGFIAAAALFWTVGGGVLLDRALRGMDRIYQQIDALIPPDQAAPTDPLKSGSPPSLIGWQGLGAQGRNRVEAFRDAATIAKVAGGAAKEPLRVSVGLNSADTAEARADLALAEMIRIGAFDRQLLVIATPTGTG